MGKTFIIASISAGLAGLIGAGYFLLDNKINDISSESCGNGRSIEFVLSGEKSKLKSSRSIRTKKYIELEEEENGFGDDRAQEDKSFEGRVYGMIDTLRDVDRSVVEIYRGRNKGKETFNSGEIVLANGERGRYTLRSDGLELCVPCGDERDLLIGLYFDYERGIINNNRWWIQREGEKEFILIEKDSESGRQIFTAELKRNLFGSSKEKITISDKGSYILLKVNELIYQIMSRQ